MIGFLLRRTAQALVVVIGVLVITFVLVHLEPGSPAKAALGPRATPTAVAAFNRLNGLDRPLIEQFGVYVAHAGHGDLGFSYTLNRSVASLVGERLPKDLVLVVISYLVALVVAVPLGIYQAVRRNTVSDYALTGGAFVFYSMPTFFLGLLLVALLAVQYHLLPPEAPQAPTALGILAHPAGLVLPVATLALVTIAQFSRYLRSSAIDNLAQDYIRTARAKGLPTRLVLRRHLLRNCLIPIVTLVGLSLPAVVAGALVTEQVFNYPGMGLAFFNAALQSDYPVLVGFTLFVGVATVIGNLLADIGYGLLDPRVRL